MTIRVLTGRPHALVPWPAAAPLGGLKPSSRLPRAAIFQRDNRITNGNIRIFLGGAGCAAGTFLTRVPEQEGSYSAASVRTGRNLALADGPSDGPPGSAAAAVPGTQEIRACVSKRYTAASVARSAVQHRSVGRHQFRSESDACAQIAKLFGKDLAARAGGNGMNCEDGRAVKLSSRRQNILAWTKALSGSVNVEVCAVGQNIASAKGRTS